MGSLQGLLGQEMQPAAEADGLQKHDLINIDVGNDFTQHYTIDHGSMECQDDGVGSQIIGGKSHHQG